MNYAFEISTPANTPKSAPQVTRRRISAGRIRQFTVFFPSGSAGLLHMRIRHGSHPLLPYNLESDLIGDNIKYELPEDILIDRQTWQVTIETWNTDDFFPHTVFVIISVLEEVSPPSWVVTLMKNLLQPQAVSARSALSQSATSISSWFSKLTGGKT